MIARQPDARKIAEDYRRGVSRLTQGLRTREARDTGAGAIRAHDEVHFDLHGVAVSVEHSGAADPPIRTMRQADERVAMSHCRAGLPCRIDKNAIKQRPPWRVQRVDGFMVTAIASSP